MKHPEREISDKRPWVGVRWRPEDVHKTYLADPKRNLYIPREFEAGIVASDIRVNFELQATEWLRELLGGGLPVPAERIWLDTRGRFVTEDGTPYQPPTDPVPHHVLSEVGGPVVVKSVTVTSDAYSFVSPDRLVRVPFKTYLRFAIAAAATSRQELRDHSADGETPGGSGTMDDWTKKVSFADIARHPVGRPRIAESDSFIYKGDRIYWQDVLDRGEAGGDKPIKGLMDNFGIPRSTAQRWLRAARSRSGN